MLCGNSRRFKASLGFSFEGSKGLDNGMEVVVQIDAFLDHGKSKDVERLETRDFPKPREKQECIAQHHCFYAEMRVCMEMNGVEMHGDTMPSNNLDMRLWSCTHGLPIKGRFGHSPEVLQALIDFEMQKVIIERIER